ncbi:MAG: signal peptidase I [Tannerellaceae bacterium]|jgi:signal peptidase I|nr:signal peptidase I [Tannerellaceae bacterium]
MKIFVDAIYYLCLAGIVYLCLRVFGVASFKIPSESMSPSLTTGDNVLVFKPAMGARLFNLFATLRGEQVAVYRTPGIRKLRRNDVVVFNFPHPHDWDTIEMHIMKYYIKRCIGLPGDTVSIRSGFFEIRGVNIPLGNVDAQRRISMREKGAFGEGIFNAFPFDSIVGWNIRDFGPLYIPRKGDEAPMNRTNYLLYRKAIEWEQKAPLEYRDSVVYLAGKPVESYTFGKNYYFVAGDRTEDSQDSRYWGLLPEEYIVGKAWLIWKSTDPYSGKFKWERFLKKIN